MGEGGRGDKGKVYIQRKENLLVKGDVRWDERRDGCDCAACLSRARHGRWTLREEACVAIKGFHAETMAPLDGHAVHSIERGHLWMELLLQIDRRYDEG